MIHIPSEFISDVCDTLGQPWVRGSLLGDKSWSCIFDNSKVKTFVPDFCATIGFAEGMRRAVRWFEEDPTRQKIDPKTNELIDKLIDAWGRGANSLKR